MFNRTGLQHEEDSHSRGGAGPVRDGDRAGTERNDQEKEREPAGE